MPAWPSITENVTKANRAFFESIRAWAEGELGIVQTEAKEAREKAESVIALPPVVRTTSHTLELSDAGTAQDCTKTGGTIEITVPAHATVEWVTGTVIVLRALGTAQIVVVAAGGVTLHNSSSLKSRTQYSVLCLENVAENEWILSGDME